MGPFIVFKHVAVRYFRNAVFAVKTGQFYKQHSISNNILKGNEKYILVYYGLLFQD